MSNPDHLRFLLESGVTRWNEWRASTPEIRPDLSGAALDQQDFAGINLANADLSFASLRGTSLRHSNLSGASFSMANLTGSDLTCANVISGFLKFVDLTDANLSETILEDAHLMSATLNRAMLFKTNLKLANLVYAKAIGAIFNQADLTGSVLIETDLTDASMVDCYVYGIAAWNVVLKGATQSNLRIGSIQVDSIELAQFLYLLLHNEKVRHVIEIITSKVVLILGRFTPDRKVVLDAIRDELRKREYVPVLFDFEKPGSKSTVETVSILAHMARFVIADLTDARTAHYP